MMKIRMVLEDVVMGLAQRIVVWRQPNSADPWEAPITAITRSNWRLDPSDTYEVHDFYRNAVVHKGTLGECIVFATEYSKTAMTHFKPEGSLNMVG